MKIDNIEHININMIAPHPDNPRKDLGDLSELVESIRENGIMQNLTVVPWFSSITLAGADDPKKQEEMGYIVVIGHRRLAAAKAAGLDEVPCVISNMDYKKQIGTMLLENMQRSDLTIYEQAKGMQMMMNLGESAENISQLTGFSKSTVYHRLNIAKLDDTMLQKAVQKQITMEDLIKLEAIEDIEKRNEVLKTAGTNSFEWNVKQAIETQKYHKARAGIIETLSTFATQITSEEQFAALKDSFTSAGYIAQYNYTSWREPKDKDSLQYYYQVEDSYINLYKEKSEEDIKKPELSEEEIAFKKASDDARDYIRLMQDKRRLFLNEYKFTEKHIRLIAEYSAKAAVYGLIQHYTSDFFIEYAGFSIDTEQEYGYEDISEEISAEPVKYMALMLACSLEQGWRKYFYIQSWCKKIEFEEDNNLDFLYEFLDKLGYEMSDWERAVKLGTHELFDEEGE